MTTQLRVKRLTAGVRLPVAATPGAAALDLFVDTTNWSLNAQAYGVSVISGRAVTFGTGLAVEVPPGHVLLIFSRSGHGFKNNTRLANCVGVIDSDYRGEVMVKLTADSFGALEVREGARIAQAMLLRLPEFELAEVDELSATERGAAGLGSTGG